MKSNIVLIGFPGVGKSTVGVLLAKETGRGFVDTDVLIQQLECRPLQAILDSDGLDAFCRIEAASLLSLDVESTVIATGGSVIYSDRAMGHLADGGVVVHLDLPLAELQRRLSNLATRGVVMPPGETLASLHAARHPLYARYADLTIDCTAKTQDEIVMAIASALQPRPSNPD